MGHRKPPTQAWIAASQRRREAMFDDYTELIELGYSPESACQRLGLKPRNLMRTAYRWKRYDIATPLGRIVDHERRRSA